MKQQDNHRLLSLNCSNRTVFYCSVIIDLIYCALRSLCLGADLRSAKLFYSKKMRWKFKADFDLESELWRGISSSFLLIFCSLAPACLWQVMCMTHVYGIWLIKGLRQQLNLDIKITTLAPKRGPPPCYQQWMCIQWHFTHVVVWTHKGI